MGRPKLPPHLLKVRKTYKLAPDVIKLIDERAEKLEISKTRYLEDLVRGQYVCLVEIANEEK